MSGDSDGTVEGIIGTSFAPGHVLNERFIEWSESIYDETDGDVDLVIEEQLDGEMELQNKPKFRQSMECSSVQCGLFNTHHKHFG